MLIFEHLSKTAGTTFHSSYLPAAFAPERRLVLRGSPDENAADQARAVEMSADAHRQPAVIAGHFAGKLREHFPGARFITLVREPVARAVSAYLHRVFHPGWHSAYGAFDPSVFKLVDFVESETFGPPYRNGQAHVLLGADFHDLDDDAIRARLARRYVSVGHTERFDEFVFSLHVTEGLPLCLFNNRLVRGRCGDIEPNEGERAVVRSHNVVDRRLHRVVRDDFEHWRQALSPDRSAMLERYLRVLRQYREETHGDENVAVRLDGSLTSWHQARWYYNIFDRFPTVGADAVAREILPLDSVTGCANADVNFQGTASATFSTSPVPWAYIATRPWPPRAQGLRLVLFVESGEVGIAVTDSNDRSQLLTQVSVGETTAPIAVDLWPDGAAGELVLRNWAGGLCRVKLLSLQVLERGVEHAGRTPGQSMRAPG
ncbi:MAG: hypothetical protein ABJA98_06890 [Acidobacteriota bacterium]